MVGMQTSVDPFSLIQDAKFLCFCSVPMVASEGGLVLGVENRPKTRTVGRWSLRGGLALLGGRLCWPFSPEQVAYPASSCTTCLHWPAVPSSKGILAVVYPRLSG